MIRRPSPNFNERSASATITYIILHYTGMASADEAVERLCDPDSSVSAHYVIDEDGGVTQLVEEEDRAWHAGQSFWHGARDLNDLSIGIELVNPGHAFGYRTFPELQIKALRKLVRTLMDRYEMKAGCILAHSDIAPTRKQDPGELFPWKKLALDGIGLWPHPEEGDYAPAGETEVTTLLRAIGYACPNAAPEIMLADQIAFLRRYHPEALASGFDAESLARLRALARMVGKYTRPLA